ncbi:hypothetical protein GCM10018772_22940 [Streptomyces fumanus]|uniref:Uncharacterized protein n=1 Tax=Streptomyces fumanus TaxID=67302 RepID=A0A919AC24_9ACTN|nr:hypothetical protein GCM10018772_22940 [Streptomyces fumanus]
MRLMTFMIPPRRYGTLLPAAARAGRVGGGFTPSKERLRRTAADGARDLSE